MSTEALRQSPFSEDQIREAKQILAGDALLAEDSIAKGMVENRGMLGDGTFVSDMAGFLNKRRLEITDEISRPITEAKILREDVLTRDSRPEDNKE